MKYKLLFSLIFLTIFLIQPVDAFIWNRPTIIEATLNVNSTNIWVTDIGDLYNPNSSQFDAGSDGNTLNLKESWVNSLWCRLTGCTMSGDILFTNDASIENVTNITLIDSIKDSNTTSRVYFDSGTFVVEG